MLLVTCINFVYVQEARELFKNPEVIKDEDVEVGLLNIFSS